MYEEYQIEIPPSFMALFVDPGRSKPNAPRAEVAARYELCEDLANMLTETASNMIFSLGITERDVIGGTAAPWSCLHAVQQALRGP